MVSRRAAVAAALFMLAYAPAHAASDSLLERVKTFLSGKLVTRARRVAGSAAVRGSAPMDQDENLDQTLLDAILAQRAAAQPDRAALKNLYEALSASYAVQAHAAAEDAALRGEAAAEISAWGRARRNPAPPAGLVAVLSKPTAGLDEATLVKAGWARHVHAIVPKPPAAAPSAPSFDSETERLDEVLDGLRDSWNTRELPSDAKARAYLLASQVTKALASAPFRVEKAAAASASRVSAELQEGSDEPAVEFSPRKVYDGASRSVVVVIGAEAGGAGELGTGSVIDASGRVLTNAHVVIRDSTKAPWPSLRVYFKPEKMSGNSKADLSQGYSARVVAHDRALDLALLEVEGAPSVAPIPLAVPPRISIGDRVAAIGHPEQGGLWTLTTGVLSSLIADMGGVSGKHVFQTDASINRGNSGGPLLDARGNIIGVNTLMSRKAADGLAITAVNFAVRSDVAARWLSEKTTATPLRHGSATTAAADPETVASLANAPARVALIKPRPAAAPKPKKETITESRPYKRDELIEREIREMEDLESEMREEVRKRR